jgi:hypothetical protein
MTRKRGTRSGRLPEPHAMSPWGMLLLEEALKLLDEDEERLSALAEEFWLAEAALRMRRRRRDAVADYLRSQGVEVAE